MIYPLLIKYKWVIISVAIIAIGKLILLIRNRINADLETRFSSPEEKAKVRLDLFRRYIQVKPAQIVFDNPERYYPYIANKFGKYIIAHQFKKSHREIRFIFENFPDVVHLKNVEPMTVKFGVGGNKKEIKTRLGDNFSNLRIIGTQGVGKTNLSKILIQQVAPIFRVIVLSTKISDFNDFKNQGIELLNPNKDDELEKFLNITNELKEKIIKEETCRTWIVLDEAIKDLAIQGWEQKKPRQKTKESIVENINFFLSLGRKFRLFLLINTQDENIKNEADLDLARIGNIICGRITNEASANLYGVPIEIAKRRDLTNGKLIFATQDNRECFVFKAYLYKPLGGR
jgi:hypothetical protein